MFEFLAGWAGLILGFSGLIFIHELGHFTLAKWNGVRVYVFSLGMGPYLFSFTHNGTVYALSLIPIGGYVKLMGQDDLNPAAGATPDPHDYRNKRAGQKAAILAAGAGFNIILTIAIFTVCYFVGMDMDVASVGNITPDSALADAIVKTPNGDQPAGLTEGTKILAVNGIPVKNQFEAMLQVSGKSEDNYIILHVDRAPPMDLVYVKPKKDKTLGATGIGLTPYSARENYYLGFSAKENVYAAGFADNSVAQKAGLKTNDIIKRINGVAISRKDELINIVRGSKGAKLDFEVDSGNKEGTTVSITPAVNEKTGAYQVGVMSGEIFRVTQVDETSMAAKKGLKVGDYFIGFQPTDLHWNAAGTRQVFTKGTLVWKHNIFDDKEVRQEAELSGLSTEPSGLFVVQESSRLYPYKAEGGFWDALSVAWTDTYHFGSSVFTVVRGMFTGDVGPGAISGPGGIAKAMYHVASSSAFVKFLWFLGFISLNLGVMQFIPIPLLDGWHLLMVAVEKLKGSPVAPKILEISQVIGIVIVGSLLLYATYNDFLRKM